MTTVPQKEAVVVIVDVGRTMCARSAESLEDTKKAVELFLQQKIFYNPKDELGVLLLGTAGTDNKLNREMGGYDHITQLQPILPTSLDTLRLVERISPGNSSGDILDGLIVAADMIVTRTEKKKYMKRIFIFTDASTPVRYMEDFPQIVSTLKDQDIQVCVVGIDFGDVTDDEGNVVAKPEAKERTEQMLNQLVEDTNNGVVLHIREAIDLLCEMRSRSVLQRTSSRPVLSFGNLKIPMWAFTKTMEQKVPTLKKMSLVSQRSVPGGSCAVKLERLYRSVDDPDTDVENKLKAFKYGKSIIPFHESDMPELKYQGEKELVCLAFTKKENIPRHHFLSSVVCFVPEPNNARAATAVSAVAQALHELDEVALVRFVFRSNADPQFGALIPCVKENAHCFYYTSLPYAEDLRYFSFPSFEPVQAKHTDTQRDAVRSLISSMDLTNVMIDGEPSEALLPKQTFNPVLQNFYRCVLHRALHPDEPLPPLDPQIAKFSKPDEAPTGILLDLFSGAKYAIESFEQAFPIKKIEEKEGEDGKKRARFWYSAAGSQQPVLDLNLDSYLDESSKKPIKKEEQLGGGVDSESIFDQPAGKRMKMELSEKEGAPIFGGAGGVEVPAKLSVEGLFPRLITNVGTTRPIDDFNELLARRDEDFVERAIEQMEGVIQRLIRDSIGSSLFEKATDCIKALRAGCLREEESERFNKFLLHVKLEHQGNKKTNGLWNLLAVRKITLISSEESPDSDVTTEQAKKFLEEATFEPVVEEPPKVEAAEEDLFDLLE